MIHTFATCNLRAGSCVRASLPEVPLGPRMHVSHYCQVGNSCAWLRGHVLAQRDRQRALSCFLGRLPCGRQHSASPRLLGPSRFWCSVAHSTESIQETKLAHQGAQSRDRGPRLFGHTCALVCINMYWYVSRVYWYVYTRTGMYPYVFVCIGMFFGMYYFLM